MTTARDARVDAYIAQAPAYAQPILAHLRDVVHAACPDVVEVTKWSRPFFDYRGAPLCFMSAFKSHCGFGFWRGKELDGLPHRDGGEGMGHFGRLASLADLPPKRELTAFVRAAMKLAETDEKPVRAKAAPRPDAGMPGDLAQALNAVPAAAEHFAAFGPGARREYIDWVVWSAEGKTHDWKYR